LVPNGNSWDVKIDIEIGRDPIETYYFRLTSYSVVKMQAFTVYVTDCSKIQITPPEPSTRTVTKNSGLTTLFTVQESFALFQLAGLNSECELTFLLYESMTEPLSAGNSALRALLDANNYQDDGNIKVQSDISSSSPSFEFEFYIAARSGSANPVVSGKITVLIGCYGVTTVQSTFVENNPIHAAFLA
jgi:hypothetical protein